MDVKEREERRLREKRIDVKRREEKGERKRIDSKRGSKRGVKKIRKKKKIRSE